MKAKVITRTIKHWGWSSSYLFSQNASGEQGASDFERLKKEYPEFVEIPFWADDFRNVPESHGCDKLVVYAWRWHGEWADPPKERGGTLRNSTKNNKTDSLRYASESTYHICNNCLLLQTLNL